MGVIMRVVMMVVMIVGVIVMPIDGFSIQSLLAATATAYAAHQTTSMSLILNSSPDVTCT